ncbi:MAG TPA: DUF309 domain-containing protein [Candidatus Thermoplasmatota archaeon]|nr:DUF309 domain-containing protein [Candidatus Thermoplasmatota archaeon]
MTSTLPPEVLEGVRLFNAGAYFDAHEAWEGHWGKGGAPERAATLGLIKAAVALHHLAAGNDAGFQWQAEKGVAALREGAAAFPALRLEALADELESLASQVRFHGRAPAGWVPPRLPL